MAVVGVSRIGGREARAQDYIDDKLQTDTDLDNLETLLQNVQEQQRLLQEQFDEAQQALAGAQKASSEHAVLVLAKAEDFHSKQADLDERLMSLTQSHTSDSAVRKLEATMTKLRRLEIAGEFVDLLHEVGKLGFEARASLKESPRDALRPYLRMRALSAALRVAQPAAEGAAPHLVDRIELQSRELYADLKTSYEESLKKTLELMKWPKKELNLSPALLAQWTDEVGNLLRLQEPDIRDDPSMEDSIIERPITKSATPVLLPLAVMVEPLAMRFRFHFYGDKPTNRLDKPEYFLSHMLDLLDRHNDFMADYLQPILDRRADDIDAVASVYTDAISAFITALLPLVEEKSLSLLPQISSQPPLLSHFTHELMSFDTTIQESWAYTPSTDLLTDWKGLTWSMLTVHGYFSAWLKVEKDFALARYTEIRDSAESLDIDLDNSDSSTKPTKGAIRVNDLVETITDRYRGLSSFSDKLKFLIEVQLEIFDDYHNYLHDRFRAFQAATHTMGRVIQGQSPMDLDVTSPKGLESLTQIFASAEYLERKMADWSDDIFFLELWQELQDRASRNTGTNSSVGRGLNISEVALKTSASINNAVGDLDMSLGGGGLFDETAASYRRLRERTEAEIVRVLGGNVSSALRPFLRMSSWASLSSSYPEPSSLSPSSALDTVLQLTASQLGYLAKVLAPAPLRRIARQICQRVQGVIYDNVLLRHRFSTAGAMQLKCDILALENVIDSSINASGEASRGMRRLEEAMTLLGLPIRGSISKAEASTDTEAWGFDDDGEEDTNADTDIDTPGENLDDDQDRIWSLWEVQKRVFKDEKSARSMLVSLGITSLSEQDAVQVLERRVEING